jgi:hypothetical protein
MNVKFVLPWYVALAMTSAVAFGAEPIAEIPAGELDRLLSGVKPQPGESPWRQVPWLTNVTEARRKAIAEDKPIVILTAADGSPLSRT